MVLLVARTRNKSHADRLAKFLRKVGSTHVETTFTVRFTAPDSIESYLRKRKVQGRKELNKILQKIGSEKRILSLMLDTSPDGHQLRNKVIAAARKQLADFPK